MQGLTKMQTGICMGCLLDVRMLEFWQRCIDILLAALSPTNDLVKHEDLHIGPRV